MIETLAPWPLPTGIRSRRVAGINRLKVHLLEAGHEGPDAGRERPCVLLLHGFPELSYSWRRVMPALAAAGYHVVAPDQRGYGRTLGEAGASRAAEGASYDDDLTPFRLLNLVRDALGLVAAIGRRSVAAVIGHDFGSIVAAWCALVRPDVFRSVVLMSAPFGGAPALPFDTERSGDGPAPERPTPSIDEALAALPRPRKHYQWYYSGREADADMRFAPQGLQAFLRAYYHHKSADWPGNRPHPLAGWTAQALAELPTYYVMDRGAGMADTVAAEMPDARQIAANRWLPDRELAVYATEFGRTGFQPALQWYRCLTSDAFVAELQIFSGRTIDVPSIYIAGASDWGIHQKPGAFEAMQTTACTRMDAVHLIPGAGHWVQQERPDEVNPVLVDFLAGH